MVIPALSTSTFTTAEVHESPALSLITAENLFVPSGASLKTRLNGSAVRESTRLPPRKKSTRMTGGFGVLTLAVIGIGDPAATMLPLIGEEMTTEPSICKLRT